MLKNGVIGTENGRGEMGLKSFMQAVVQNTLFRKFEKKNNVRKRLMMYLTENFSKPSFSRTSNRICVSLQSVTNFCSLFTCTWLKVNKSRYKQCGVTPHFFIGQNLLKKILRKDKYWHNQFRKAFWWIRWPQIMQYNVTR